VTTLRSPVLASEITMDFGYPWYVPSGSSAIGRLLSNVLRHRVPDYIPHLIRPYLIGLNPDLWVHTVSILRIVGIMALGVNDPVCTAYTLALALLAGGFFVDDGKELTEQNRVLSDMTRTPLFLSLMCRLHEDGGLSGRTKRGDLVDRCLGGLLLDWQIEDEKLRRIWIEITELEKVLVLNQEQVETAIEKTEEEQKVYDQGRSDLTFVIQSRDDVSLARLRYATNAATYQKLLLSYRAMIDELFPND